ncbi:tRNA uridine-5-carboxymethylaminomethyl(34) synthesis GTPase MnmE [Pseudochelatococcus contaminans]|uniref:tRNA modification GTPase MnmE n=1 Tax=Pseudochelatococcus contaminans TaxID=1538103 RepID=A0A7W5Z7C7_9HYPH|nr:tRNA uridine-5-carboxymethylaminomethyl(34) synthesis GTPase MnmE [Pseudochelatococcus contaminans]MBB3811037.1 tRNA modification GTPase [Pseudochelatococcus contaminans]
MSNSDTIVALATAPGRSAIAVLRLSGPSTKAILDTLCGNVPEARRASLRRLRNSAGELLDQAVVLYFSSPASFTGEDAAEFHLHGGQAVVSAVLRAILDTGLGRLAEPGEFSRRAFLNGRLDLTAAEGIADLIDAETEAQRQQAMRQLEGSLSETVESWRDRLITAMALTEASLDFSDEGDVPDGLIDEGIAISSAVHTEIVNVLNDGRTGERLRTGFSVAIVGPPNAGKSTLLNRIAGREVAIVSPFAGTTRDAIEVRCDIDGFPVVFVDTAGLRDTEDEIEREGVKRARQRAEAADLILQLHAPDNQSSQISGSETIWPIDVELIAVRTKADISLFPCTVGDANTHADFVISAVTGQGIDDLLLAIKRRISKRTIQAPLITRERHRRALIDTVAHLERISETSSRAINPEFIAEDMRLSLRALGQITGRVGVEHILDKLFSGFCIGK